MLAWAGNVTMRGRRREGQTDFDGAGGSILQSHVFGALGERAVVRVDH